jgi:SAM-dependent methyltransferase
MATDGIPADLKGRMKDSYNAIAETYNGWTAQHFETRNQALAELIPLLKQKDGHLSTLELGCGCGLPVMKTILELPDVTYTGNDLSGAQIAIAKENLGPDPENRANFIEGDMLAISQPDATLDAVIAMYSIIHLPREEQVQLVHKIFSWLKPGGYFLANFAEEDLPAVVMPAWLHEKGWMFWSGWGAKTTVKKVQEAGFKIISEAIRADVVDSRFLWILAKKP